MKKKVYTLARREERGETQVNRIPKYKANFCYVYTHTNKQKGGFQK